MERRKKHIVKLKTEVTTIPQFNLFLWRTRKARYKKGHMHTMGNLKRRAACVGMTSRLCKPPVPQACLHHLLRPPEQIPPRSPLFSHKANPSLQPTCIAWKRSIWHFYGAMSGSILIHFLFLFSSPLPRELLGLYLHFKYGRKAKRNRYMIPRPHVHLLSHINNI